MPFLSHPFDLSIIVGSDRMRSTPANDHVEHHPTESLRMVMSNLKRIRLLVIGCTAITLASASSPAVEPGPTVDGLRYRADPATVQRFGAGYRYPQAGWIVLHIEGEPYERGYQHGRLMAPEIARFVGELARYRSTQRRPTPGRTCGCWPMPCSCADSMPNISRR